MRHDGLKTMADEPKKNEPLEKILIKGVTEEGQTFRPGDWAERMSGNLCTFQNHRMVYSPLLQPVVRNGQKCMLIDPHSKKPTQHFMMPSWNLLKAIN